MTTTTFPRRLTEKEAAAQLGLSHRTLQRWRVRGGGPPYLKLGASVRYDEAALDRWAKAQTWRHTTYHDPQSAGA